MYSNDDIDMLSVGHWQSVNGGVTQLSSSSLHTLNVICDQFYLRKNGYFISWSWTKIEETIGTYNVAGKTLWWLSNHKLHAYTTYTELYPSSRECVQIVHIIENDTLSHLTAVSAAQETMTALVKKSKNNRAARATRF